MPGQQFLILTPGQPDFCRAAFISGAGIGMVHQPVPAVHLSQAGNVPQTVTFLNHPCGGAADTIPSAAVHMPFQDHAFMGPVKQIPAHRQRGLVSFSVKARIKHVKQAIMHEHKGNIHRHLVKCPVLP